MNPIHRRTLLSAGTVAALPRVAGAAASSNPQWSDAIDKGLDFLSRNQSGRGQWNTGAYPTAMAALAGTALIGSGSTTTQGPYAKNIARAADYLISKSRDNGLIGDPATDNRYTYGHGFSMLFLSQVYGEEEDIRRRERIQDVLTKAVEFSAYAQTDRGGWGYVSARDGNNFDEGSTCITQVQGLRAARNAGIPVPKEIIDRARKYIDDCTTPEGGVLYSIKRSGGARPPITAAALASLFSAGEYEGDKVEKMLDYCKRNVWPSDSGMRSNYGHWHYAHYYYAQVIYRLGDEQWHPYQRLIVAQIIPQQAANGAWKDGHIGPVYTTAINATILQLDKGYLPIYQR